MAREARRGVKRGQRRAGARRPVGRATRGVTFDAGVLVALDTDAHSTFDFAHLKYGIGQARRAWLEPEDVLNTRSLKELRQLLARTIGR